MFQTRTGVLAKVYREMKRMPQTAEKAYFKDVAALRSLHLVHSNDPDYHWMHHRYQQRMAIHRLIQECAENGQILVIESGMDCDCVQYDGRTRVIEASIKAYDELEREVGEWADGPFSFSIARPSEEANIHYRSRDRALEAYEDGHPHSIHLGDIDD